jgi:hypothetical protein
LRGRRKVYLLLIGDFDDPAGTPQEGGGINKCQRATGACSTPRIPRRARVVAAEEWLTIFIGREQIAGRYSEQNRFLEAISLEVPLPVVAWPWLGSRPEEHVPIQGFH